MDFSPFDAPVSVEPSTLSLCAVPSFSPIVRDVNMSDTRHLPVIASFAHECQPSEMMVMEYTVTFYGPDRYIMAIRLFRYLVSAGLARVAFRIPSARSFHGVLVARDGASIAAFIGKAYVFIG
jgi:hypothetical protein